MRGRITNAMLMEKLKDTKPTDKEKNIFWSSVMMGGLLGLVGGFTAASYYDVVNLFELAPIYRLCLLAIFTTLFLILILFSKSKIKFMNKNEN